MIKLIFRYIKKYWYIALLAPTFMICEVGMDFLLTQQMQILIDEGIQTLNKDVIIECGWKMIIILFVGVICGVLSGVFTNLTSYKCVNDMRQDLFSKILSLSYNQTDKFSTASLVIRVTNDVSQIQQLISMSLRMFVRQISMFVLGIVFTLTINVKFAYVLAVVIPIELLIMALFLVKGAPFFNLVQKKIDRVNTVVHENVSGARVVKAFNKEEYEINRFENANIEHTNVQLKIQNMIAFLMPLLMITIYIAQVVVYGISGKSIFDAYVSPFTFAPEIMVGQVNQAITYMMMICMSLMMFGMLALFITRGIASAKRILEVLNCELEIKDGNFDLKDKKDIGTVEFKNVSFKYPDTSSNVLESLFFKVNKGETIAIVGGTGSGKSSLVNLITRFYDVSEGEILVDSINIKEYKQKDLRDIVAICLQKSELFAGTIEDNIRWGNLNASEEEILKALDIAQASEFVNGLDKGIKSWVEEKGTSLSGGQKQRLSIARAIIKKPEILIFDDSTSALDLVTEAKLYKAMNKNIKDVTKIVVAQRVATAKKADKIIVLDQGKIVALDTHDNLMKNCSVYIDIYNSQLKEGDINGE